MRRFVLPSIVGPRLILSTNNSKGIWLLPVPQFPHPELWNVVSQVIIRDPEIIPEGKVWSQFKLRGFHASLYSFNLFVQFSVAIEVGRAKLMKHHSCFHPPSLGVARRLTPTPKLPSPSAWLAYRRVFWGACITAPDGILEAAILAQGLPVGPAAGNTGLN